MTLLSNQKAVYDAAKKNRPGALFNPGGTGYRDPDPNRNTAT